MKPKGTFGRSSFLRSHCAFGEKTHLTAAVIQEHARLAVKMCSKLTLLHTFTY